MSSTGRPVVEIAGQRFGRLTAVSLHSRDKGGHGMWLCVCDCGAETIARSGHLREGKTQSCGCLSADLAKERNYSKREDLTGQRFGFWTVLSFAETRKGPSGSGGNATWLCRCDCGVEKNVQASTLKYIREPKCRACADDALLNPQWALHLLLKRYRHNATARGLAFLLTDAEFETMLAEPCYYCGAIRGNTLKHPRNPRREFQHNGIDRLNGGDYTAGNSVSCCWPCNRLKNGMSAADFIARCKLIAKHRTD